MPAQNENEQAPVTVTVETPGSSETTPAPEAPAAAETVVAAVAVGAQIAQVAQREAEAAASRESYQESERITSLENRMESGFSELKQMIAGLGQATAEAIADQEDEEDLESQAGVEEVTVTPTTPEAAEVAPKQVGGPLSAWLKRNRIL